MTGEAQLKAKLDIFGVEKKWARKWGKIENWQIERIKPDSSSLEQIGLLAMTKTVRMLIQTIRFDGWTKSKTNGGTFERL